MAQVTGVNGSTVELLDSIMISLRKLRESQAKHGGTLRGASFAAGGFSPISAWTETLTGGGTLNVTLAIPITVAATADGYSVSADAEFDDGL